MGCFVGLIFLEVWFFLGFGLGLGLVFECGFGFVLGWVCFECVGFMGVLVLRLGLGVAIVLSSLVGGLGFCGLIELWW